MEYARAEGMGWRGKLEPWIRTALGHSVFNPSTESVKFLARRLPRTNFRSLKTKDFPRFKRVVSQIVDLDSREIVRKSTYLICYWDRSAQRGAGTKGEITLAHYFRKPVYLVTRMRPESIPGWVIGCTTEVFPSFRVLKSFLVKKFG